MRSLEVICQMWILLNYSFYSDYCKPLEKPDPERICSVRKIWMFSNKMVNFKKSGYFFEKWIFRQKSRLIFVQFRFPIILISTLWNSGIISVGPLSQSPAVPDQSPITSDPHVFLRALCQRFARPSFPLLKNISVMTLTNESLLVT